MINLPGVTLVKEEDAEGIFSVAARFLYRDHHGSDGTRPLRSKIHSVSDDELLEPGKVLSSMLMESGFKDGDEFEICLIPTGKRPHGDRWFLFPQHRPETDDEIIRRIEDGN